MATRRLGCKGLFDIGSFFFILMRRQFSNCYNIRRIKDTQSINLMQNYVPRFKALDFEIIK